MESKIKQRNPVYDCAKGLGILFVVMGHCYALGYQFYTKFHVLFFFVFSGLMLKSDSIVNLNSLWQNICKFWKRYALPYIVCNSMFLIFYNVFIKYHLITSDFRYSTSIAYIDLNILVTKIIKIFLLIASSEQLCGATWFLRSLFWGLLSIVIILFITKKINKFVVFAITSVFLIALTIMFDNRLLFLYVQSVLCIIIGDLFKDYIHKITSKKRIYEFWGSAIMILLSIYFIRIKVLSMLICAIFGFIFMLQSSLIIEKYAKQIYNLLIYLGQNTIPILCLHLLSFKIITYLYVIITNSDIFLLGAFPSISNTNHQFILSFAYTTIGILLPILCYQIYIGCKNSFLIIKGRYE